MITGLWGAPLKSISAFLPPLSTQDFDLSGGASPMAANLSSIKIKKYESIFKRMPKVGGAGLMNGMITTRAIDVAEKLHKPVLIDFTGWNCVELS